MGQFIVKLSGMEQRIDEEQRIANSLNSIESRIWSVRNALSFEISSRGDIKKILSNLASDVNEQESDLNTMRFVLKNIRDQYEKTENRICGKVNDYTITSEEVWDALTTIGQGIAVNALFPGMGIPYLIYEILKDEEWKTESESGKFKHTIKEKKRDEYEYDFEKDEWVKKPEDDEEKTDAQKKKEILDNVILWSGSIGKEGSLLHFGKDGDVETDWGNYTYSADIMKAEANAEFSIGLGGISAEVGMALTAFRAGAGAQYGSDMLGVHGNVEFTAGKVEAKGEAKVEWVNEDGDFDPNIKVSGSLEAIAAEISGEVGVDVLGTEINGTASINVGIGAHADIGFSDGKLEFKLGASLGIGFSVDLEIDMSGTIDAAAEFVSDIGETAQEAYEAVSNAIGDAAEAVSDAIDDFADAAADIWNKGWSTFTSWF